MSDAKVGSTAARAGRGMEPTSPIGEMDLHLFNEGTHTRLYEKLGAHITASGGRQGTHFAVWAPDAVEVTVVGDFNGWDKTKTPLALRGGSGIWEGFVPDVGRGDTYKYHIRSRHSGYSVDKSDPYAFHTETPPATGSKVWDLDYEWRDADWMGTRAGKNSLEAPMAIYEVHLGSWMRDPQQPDRFLSYRELAPLLADYVDRHGFTHVEFLPVMEHPFYGSWGYQVSNYFAPTSRYGTPQDLMCLIDTLHQRGIGVILDWVPAHFPTDEHALGYFDGTHLYEHADPRRGFHPDWKSFIFNYGRLEVRSFLTSSAVFWLDKYHVDGLRVDGVASMLYLDYSREDGEWLPNEHGGRENLEAISLLRHVNEHCYGEYPDIQTMAEESTAWPMVSRPSYLGGLGFGLKWDLGWMHDTLDYIRKEPVHRKFHHNELTFRTVYAFNESFVLPLSHDEVVHGKGSLIGKMPGDEWQKFANLRLLLSYMYATPGKKLLFMGGEIGQWREWNHDGCLDWHLLEHAPHRGVQDLVAQLNRLHREEPALHELDRDPRGFEWIDASDWEQSVLVFLRRGRAAEEQVVVACNFTPVVRTNYRIGVDEQGFYRELFNSDATDYGGSGVGNYGRTEVAPVSWHGRRFSLNVTLPPLGALFLKHERP
ncbi:MAG: 1,4-alpha-glucan branching protein GlgB [Myxococcota bacterium]